MGEITEAERLQGFLDAIMTRTPRGEWIAVQYHPDGDWSVAHSPLEPSPPTESIGYMEDLPETPKDEGMRERVARAIARHLRISVGSNPDCDDQNRVQDHARYVSDLATYWRKAAPDGDTNDQ